MNLVRLVQMDEELELYHAYIRGREEEEYADEGDGALEHGNVS